MGGKQVLLMMISDNYVGKTSCKLRFKNKTNWPADLRTRFKNKTCKAQEDSSPNSALTAPPATEGLGKLQVS